RHVGRARVEVPAHLRLSLAVVAVTGRAVICKVRARLGENGGGERHGVFLMVQPRGYRPAAHASREKRFHSGRRVMRAEAISKRSDESEDADQKAEQQRADGHFEEDSKLE